MANKKIPRGNNWVPMGVMFGAVAGLVLSMKYNNFLYLAGGAVAGLFLGSLMDSSEFEEKDMRTAIKEAAAKKAVNKKTPTKKTTTTKKKKTKK